MIPTSYDIIAPFLTGLRKKNYTGCRKRQAIVKFWVNFEETSKYFRKNFGKLKKKISEVVELEIWRQFCIKFPQFLHSCSSEMKTMKYCGNY